LIWADFIARAAGRLDDPAVICPEGRFTYGALIDRVEALARQLPARPEGRPGRVLLTETEPFALLVHVLACWAAGLVPAILREGRQAASAADLATFLQPVAVLGPGVDLPAAEVPPWPRAAFGPRDEALVFCTSGTTSAPKVVALPAESVVINATTIGADLGFRAEDVVGVPTPLTYMYGLMGGACAALWAGAAIRLFRPSDPLTVFQAAIRSEAITVVQGPPSLLRLFLGYWNEQPFASVRLVTTGGERIDPALLQRLRDAFPAADLRKLYGMTEAGPRISHVALDEEVARSGRIGRPFGHLDWRIDPVDLEGIPEGAGRLTLRGPSLFLGFLRQDGGYQGWEADGFFRSSDLVQPDGKGGLRFLDRLDGMFKCGGKLVSPAEVEAVLSRLEGVAEARCTKEAHSLLGWVPVADVVPRDGAELTAGQVLDHCRGLLQQHAVPRRVHFLSEMPLRPSGKRG
jgi:acyl-CoA synthetase (AMP-forming)/AMP-acid ligase II